MVSWVVIALVILGAMIFFKTTGVRFGRTWTMVIGAIIVFVVVTLGYVITRPGINLLTLDGFISAVKIYVFWLQDVFDNLFKITGSATKIDWAVNISKYS